MTLLSRIDRFNSRHPWSHNDFYGSWVADKVGASGTRRVLDIGCGTGNLIDRLRTRVDHVTGIEPDPATARFAAARFAEDESVVIEQLRFDRLRSTGRWDAITLVASLHHLPPTDTLREPDRHLSPGGRLVVIGCFRDSSPIDNAKGVVTVSANLVIGTLKHPRVAQELPVEMTAPVTPAPETLAEIRSAAAECLPGARIRRRLFWRHPLVYDRPAVADPHGTETH